jgi:hypothetical protein
LLPDKPRFFRASLSHVDGYENSPQTLVSLTSQRGGKSRAAKQKSGSNQNFCIDEFLCGANIRTLKSLSHRTEPGSPHRSNRRPSKKAA